MLILCIGMGCSTLGDLAKDAVLGSADKGTEVTAQVGKENNKGLNAKLDQSQEIAIDKVEGSATIGSGNITNVDATTMIGLVLAGMLPPCLLLFWLLPVPRWFARRQRE